MRREGNVRFIVELPCKTKPLEKLGGSRETAMKRFLALKGKLNYVRNMKNL